MTLVARNQQENKGLSFLFCTCLEAWSSEWNMTMLFGTFRVSQGL